MQTPPGEAFPFSTTPPESEVKTEAQTKETEARSKEDAAVPAEAGRRVTLIEQMMLNRPESKGARFLGFIEAIKALFVSPTGPDGRRQISGNRSLGMANSLMGLFAAFKGEAPAGVRNQLGLPPAGSPNEPGANAETSAADKQAMDFLTPIFSREAVNLRRLPSPQLRRLAELARQLGPDVTAMYSGAAGIAISERTDFRSFARIFSTTPRGARAMPILINRMFPGLPPAGQKAKAEEMMKAMVAVETMDPADAAIFDALARTGN